MAKLPLKPLLLLWLCLTVLLTLRTSVLLEAQEVLTNDSVIAMVRAGLEDSLVVAKIESTKGKFDLSTEGLVSLKQAGVSAKVIETMMKAGTASGTTGVSASPFKSRNSIYYLMGGQYVEMSGLPGQVETSAGFASKKAELVIEGRNSKLRITERLPVFFSPAPIARVPLVRLRIGDSHNDRNLHIGEASRFSGKSGLRKEDIVDVVVERDPRSDDRGEWYRIVPREPLAPGEYGFPAGRQIFDFGID